MSAADTLDSGAASFAAFEDDWHAPHNPWLIAVVTTMATFMEVLDTTIVNVALPHIAGSLAADVNDSTWVLTSYLVANAVILPLSAWCAELIGRRNFYMVCVTLFTVSSFLCGLAPTLGTLVFFRLLQGIGGGGLQPITQAILVDTFPARQRGMGMAVFGMTVVVAPVIGPTLGGWITDNYSWRWIFYINIPVGLLSLYLTSRWISDPPYLKRRRGPDRFRVDYVGLGLLCLGLGALQMALDLGERYDWFESRFITTLGVVTVVSLSVGVIWEWRHHDPLLDFRLLRDRNLGMTTAIMLLFAATLYASTVVLTLFMQTLMGYTALLSGLCMSPGGIATLFTLPLIGFLVSRWDARLLIGFGIIVIFCALMAMGRLSLQAGFWSFMTDRTVQGLGMAFIFVPVNAVAYAYVAREARNAASSLISVARNIGGSVGIAVATSMIARGSQAHQNFLVGHLTPYDPDFTATVQNTTALMLGQSGDPAQASLQAHGAIYGMVQQQAATLAFVDVFHAFALVALVILPLVLLLKKPPATTEPMPVH